MKPVHETIAAKWRGIMSAVKPIPIIGLPFRYPMIMVMTSAFLYIAIHEEMFRRYGTYAFFPCLFFAPVVGAILTRHVFWRNTLDEFVVSGGFVRAWNALTAEQKFKCVMCVTLTLIASFSLIVGLVAK